jgi:2-polyprenyl-3-methyl-5-hydroxy-6-metoxy-1,4-benzoquinol methylase
MKKKHYDEMYQSGGSAMEEISILKFPRTRWEFAVKHSHGGNAVADIGCGHGNVLYSLRNKYGRLVGFEVSANRIQTARNNLLGNSVDFHLQPFDEEFALPERVDACICLDVLDHMVDVRQALRNMYNIIKEDGHLILTVPNVARIDRRIKLLMGNFPSTSTKSQGVEMLGNSGLFDGGKLHYFTFASLEALLVEVGFAKIERYGIGRFGSIYNLYPQLLSGAIALVCRK